MYLRPLSSHRDHQLDSLFESLKKDYETLLRQVSELRSENLDLKNQFRDSLNLLVEDREKEKNELTEYIRSNQELHKEIQSQKLKLHEVSELKEIIQSQKLKLHKVSELKQIIQSQRLKIKDLKQQVSQK